MRTFDPDRELLLLAVSRRSPIHCQAGMTHCSALAEAQIASAAEPSQAARWKQLMAEGSANALKANCERWWQPRPRPLGPYSELQSASFEFKVSAACLMIPQLFPSHAAHAALCSPQANQTTMNMCTPNTATGAVTIGESSLERERPIWMSMLFHQFATIRPFSSRRARLYLEFRCDALVIAILIAQLPAHACNRPKDDCRSLQVEYTVWLCAANSTSDLEAVSGTDYFEPCAGYGWGYSAVREAPEHGDQPITWDGFWAEGSRFMHNCFMRRPHAPAAAPALQLVHALVHPGLLMPSVFSTTDCMYHGLHL